MCHAECASYGEAVCDRSPNEYCRCATGDALEHVRSAAYAAVDQHRASPRHPLDDLRKNVERGRRSIKRASTVVRHDQAAPAMFEDEVGIIAAENPLHQNR